MQQSNIPNGKVDRELIYSGEVVIPDRYRSRFNDRLAEPDMMGCRLWQGSRTAGGYGQLTVLGYTYPTHVLAMLMSGNCPPFEGAVIDHICRVRSCTETSHLEWVTRKENTNRSPLVMGHTWNRGHSMNRGENHGRAKLTEDGVFEIRRVVDCGVPRKAVAKQWGISERHVSRIVNRERWPHI